jgi:F0F1-type ATP synthase epsilon subunit
MLFFLATPEYNLAQSNTTKIKVHLSTGIAEILDQHQDLMGKIDNDIVEIETNFDNKIEKLKFLVQEGVFVVSTKNSISSSATSSETGIYVYAKRSQEISSKISIDDITKQYEIKKDRFEKEEEKFFEGKKETVAYNRITNTKLCLLKEEVEFFKKAISVLKDLKN